ncbi:MAG: NAD-dependent epimerase/dehydratase family protein [Phycisphaeraceae bacterium]
MKLLITGASGFLGRHLVSQAVQRGHQVRAQIRPASNIDGLNWDSHPQVEIMRIDLRQKSGLDNLVQGCDAVISNAACKAGDFYTQFAGTVITTENLLQTMAACHITRLVSVSTFSVYDFMKLRDGALLDESTPLDDDPIDRDEYAQTKLIQERLAWRFAEEHKGKVTVVRPGVVYGKDNTWTARIGMELGANRCLLVGGRTCLPLTYVENCAQGIVVALESDNTIGEIYNIVDDDLPTHRQYVRALNKHRKPKMKTVPLPWLVMRMLASTAMGVNTLFLKRQAKIPSILRPAALHARCKPNQYTNRKIKEATGWSPTYPLEQALSRSFDGVEHAALSVPSDQHPTESNTDQEASTCV